MVGEEAAPHGVGKNRGQQGARGQKKTDLHHPPRHPVTLPTPTLAPPGGHPQLVYWFLLLFKASSSNAFLNGPP